MGPAPAQKGARAVRGGVCTSGSDLSAPAPQMIRMSTGHMEGNLQLLYVLLTDCYVYLLRKGACRPGLGQGTWRMRLTASSFPAPATPHQKPLASHPSTPTPLPPSISPLHVGLGCKYPRT